MIGLMKNRLFMISFGLNNLESVFTFLKLRFNNQIHLVNQKIPNEII